MAGGVDRAGADVVEGRESSAEGESSNAVIYQGDGKAITLEDKIDQNPKEQGGLVDKIVLMELLEALLPIEREIITLRYFEDRTQTEIAALLEISLFEIALEHFYLSARHEVLIQYKGLLAFLNSVKWRYTFVKVPSDSIANLEGLNIIKAVLVTKPLFSLPQRSA